MITVRVSLWFIRIHIFFYELTKALPKLLLTVTCPASITPRGGCKMRIKL